MSIRLLLVDDQDIIRRGLKALLRQEPSLEVIGEANQGQAALDWLEGRQARSEPLPDVILMDIRMPVMDGVVATLRVRQTFPALRVLVLTTFDDEVYVSQALQNGASGYLLKDTPLEELTATIHSVSKGYLQLGPGLADKLLRPTPKPPTLPPELEALTTREREILDLIAKGASNREIAQQLYISEKTVKNHITHILSQLGLRDRTQAALFAQGVLPSDQG